MRVTETADMDFIPTPSQLRDHRPHVIHLRVAGTKQELTNSPKVIHCR